MIFIYWTYVNEILKFKHLDFNVGKTFLLVFISIKIILSFGSSSIFNKALIELIFNKSILSIKTNLGLELNDDLFKFEIKSLIWLISIFFLSSLTSIKFRFGFVLFWVSLYDLFSWQPLLKKMCLSYWKIL